jgi:hypothetical protein
LYFQTDFDIALAVAEGAGMDRTSFVFDAISLREKETRFCSYSPTPHPKPPYGEPAFLAELKVVCQPLGGTMRSLAFTCSVMHLQTKFTHWCNLRV